MNKKLILVPLLITTLFISGCNNDSSNNDVPIDKDKKDFTDVYFDDVSISYDGNSHILNEVRGAPSGTTITYSNRDYYIDAGSYKASAKLEKENYNTKTIEATLTITPIDFNGLKYESTTVYYDGKDHINDVKLVGVQPDGTITKQKVKDSLGNEVTSAIEVGSYYYEIEISNKNYNKLTLTATLDIKKVKNDMPVFASSDGIIYFANGLDNRYLYSLNRDNAFKRIDFSSPKEFNRYSSTKALFISGTSIMNAVKEVDNGVTNIIYTDSNIDDFVKYSESIYFYSCNSITSSKSGIYKVDNTNSNEEPIITKVFEGKTDNLAIYGSNLYFTNGNDNNYIYKLDINTYKTSLILSEKTHEFVIYNNKLYCVVNGVLNDYIGYIDLSKTSNREPIKLTNASGEFLVIKNGNLYFNYTDLFGKIDSSKYGIWSINLATLDLKQILPISSINGFDVESNGSIVYIDTDDLHLYRYNPSNNLKNDLLKDFVIPEYIPLNTGGHTVSYENKIYFLNMYAGKTLYVYDEKTNKNYQLSTNKVIDFFIYGDKLYFNQVTMFTNNDLYVVDLKIGSEAQKISSNDVRNMVSDGNYIYATHYNWAGFAGGISRFKMDGSEYVKFSDINGAKNLTIKDDKLYYINATGDNGNIEYINLSSISSSSSKLEGTNLNKNIKNVKQFIFDNDYIYYCYDGTFDNSIQRTTFSNLDKKTKIASTKTNPNEMILWGDYIVYYSYPVSSLNSAGFYKVNKLTNSDEGAKKDNLILSCDSSYYGSDLTISNSDNLYFLNYLASYALGDAHTYQLNLNNKMVTKIV